MENIILLFIIHIFQLAWPVQTLIYGSPCIIGKKMKPTVEQVKERFGPDTAELYRRALLGELTEEDIFFIDETDEDNEVLKPMWGWNLESMEGCAAWLIRDIEYEFES